MAEVEEAGPMSVKDRIAQLKLNQVGRTPGQPSSPNEYTATNGTTATPRARPPPPPRPDLPSRPSANSRPQSISSPPTQDHGSVANWRAGQQPDVPPSANGMDGISRPALPPRTSTQSSLNPPLPPRRPSERSPALPPRRPSETPSQPDYQLSRKASNDSISSVATGRSSISAISATTGTSVGSYKIRAPSYDPSSLPALPPKQTQEQKDAYYTAGTKYPKRTLKSTFSSPNMTKQNGTTPPPNPRRLSGQPTTVNGPRTVNGTRIASVTEEPAVNEAPLQIEPARPQNQPLPSRTPIAPPRPTRSIEPPPPARKSALEWGMNKSTNLPPPITTPRPSSVPPATNGNSDGAPPPIPTGSRPDLNALQSSKPTMGVGGQPRAGVPGSCLHCRDFSAPDSHATRFPRQSLPSTDAQWLATQLTAPFESLTDKARAIFSWFHHNVAYDTVSFFGNTVKKSTPKGVIESGLAVCEGYAATFADLALKAGLECYVVSGASKGFGHTPGAIKPYKSTHAWNVVKLDNGVWKLIDACWGAGHLGGNNKYEKSFHAERFTQSNMDFGLDHYPGNEEGKQFREDGRVLTYEEWWFADKKGAGDKVICVNCIRDGGLAAESLQPYPKTIALAQQPGPTVRFSFQKICPHWDSVRNGQGLPFFYILKLDAEEGTKKQPRVFNHNGTVWWVDVPTAELGRPGQKVYIWRFNEFAGEDAKGLTVEKYRKEMGRTGYSYQTLCTWEVA